MTRDTMKAIEAHKVFAKSIVDFINECLDNGVSPEQIQYSFTKYIDIELEKRRSS